MDQRSKRALAAGAESAEALRALAAERGITLTVEEARAYFAKLHPPAGELADDELEAVSSGGCGTHDKFKAGDHVMLTSHSFCGSEHSDYRGAQPVQVTCYSPYWVITGKGKSGATDFLETIGGGHPSAHYSFQCPQCGMSSSADESQLSLV